MHLGIVLNTAEPETVWNAFRLGITALEEGHDVTTFLLGDGVEAPDVESEKYNAHGVLRKYENEGGTLLACGTCLDSRDLESDDLRPRASMADLLSLSETADRVLTFG
ncbi:MAG: DsrE family protein [Halanaeroarchaeum sp.]